MVNLVDQSAQEAAAQWVIRLRHARAPDWLAFTEWLEESPVHPAAYEQLAQIDHALDGLSPPRAQLPESDSPSAARPLRWRAAGWAAAASIALVLGFAALGPGSTMRTVETAAGERRTVALADGSRIDLNGATRIRIDDARPRFATLERGEALFTVIHDETAPFEVAVGEDVVYDLGTVFNVAAASGTLRVGVAAGAVVVNPRGAAVRLSPGMVLEKDAATATIRRQPPDAIGAWRDGRLVYTDEPVGAVAIDIGRAVGAAVTVDPGIASRRFTGVISLDGDAAAVLARASALLGVRARRANGEWRLSRD